MSITGGKFGNKVIAISNIFRLFQAVANDTSAPTTQTLMHIEEYVHLHSERLTLIPPPDSVKRATQP